MSTGARIAAAAASGYILGRTKKLKLAIAVGSMLAGKRLATDPRGMMRQANELIESNPELAKLSGQVRTTLYTAARGAAVGAVGQRIDRLSDSIRDRSEKLTGGLGLESRGSDDEQAEDEQAPDEEAPDEEAPDEPRRTAARKASSKSAPAKQTAAKKSAPAKKSTAKKSTAKKSTAKKPAPAKRSASGQGGSAGKRAAAKKSSGRSRSAGGQG